MSDPEDPADVGERDESPSPKPTPRPSPRRRPQPTPRSGATPSAKAEDIDSDRANARFRRIRSRMPGRKMVISACLVVAIVLLASAATWFALEANGLREGDPEDNSAIVDEAATGEVREQISSAVESVFSYNYASMDRTRRAADRVLLDEALKQYNAELAEASAVAEKRKLVRTASVRAIGVRSLHDDTARVMVFLDQQTLETSSGEQHSNTAYVHVVAKKDSGSWKIATLSGP